MVFETLFEIVGEAGIKGPIAASDDVEMPGGCVGHGDIVAE